MRRTRYPCKYQPDFYVHFTAYFIHIITVALIMQISTWFFSQIFFRPFRWQIIQKKNKKISILCLINLFANIRFFPRHFCPSSSPSGVCDQLTPPAFAMDLISFGRVKIYRYGNFEKKMNATGPYLLYLKNCWKCPIIPGRKRPVGTWWVKGNVVSVF